MMAQNLWFILEQIVLSQVQEGFCWFKNVDISYVMTNEEEETEWRVMRQ